MGWSSPLGTRHLSLSLDADYASNFCYHLALTIITVIFLFKIYFHTKIPQIPWNPYDPIWIGNLNESKYNKPMSQRAPAKRLWLLTLFPKPQRIPIQTFPLSYQFVCENQRRPSNQMASKRCIRNTVAMNLDLVINGDHTLHTFFEQIQMPTISCWFLCRKADDDFISANVFRLSRFFFCSSSVQKVSTVSFAS